MERLISDCLRCLEDGGEPALRAFLDAHPSERAELEEHLAVLRGAGLLEPVDALGVPARLGEFELRERLGGGGMGVVHRAWQPSLGREVALKVIRPDRVHLDAARRRFRLEAEAIAGLSHPGIVPVYAFGEDQGLPWFAMELLEGATFGDALACVAGSRPAALRGADLGRAVVASMRSPPPRGGGVGGRIFDGSWSDVCARVVARVADAVAAAHDHGVLHRDVKPSNVMLTPEGRVLLFDFGLTRSGGTGVSITRAGDLVGSPAYMAPEQLRGGRIDARTDVYALGVTLYESLALELPFLAADEHDLRNRIVAGDAVPLRHRNPGVSWELETVCAVAMDPEPARRYASASALRDDLDRVLARVPIVARRPGTLLRARRLAQRHPAAVVASTAAALALVAIPSLLGLREASARRRIEIERAAGERHLQTALDAMDRFLSRFGGDELAYAPGVGDVGRALLDDSIQLHEQLRRERPEDRRILLALSEARRRAAWLALRSGQLDQAESLALAAAEPVASGDDLALIVQRVVATRTRAAVARARGDYEGVELLLRDALSTCERAEPSSPRLLAVTALAETDLGRVLTDLGEHAEASAWLEDSVARLDRLPAGEIEYSSSRIQALRCLATARFRNNDFVGGHAALRTALDALEARLSEPDPPPGVLSMAAQTLVRLGTGSSRAEAAALAERAVGLAGPLAATYPDVVSYRSVAIDAHLLASTVADRETARRSIASAVELADGLPAGYPDLDLVRVRIARHEFTAIRGSAAVSAWEERTRALLLAFDDRAPALPYDRLELGMAWHALGCAGLDQRSFEMAADALRRALRWKEPLLAEIGLGSRIRSLIASSRSGLADALLTTDPEGALNAARQALDELLEEDSADAGADELFGARQSLAYALLTNGRFDEAAALAGQILAADLDPEHAISAARVLIGAAGAVAEGREALLRGAVEAVDQAATRGFRDVDVLLEDGRFAPLRTRRDFMPVVRRVRDGR